MKRILIATVAFTLASVPVLGQAQTAGALAGAGAQAGAQAGSSSGSQSGSAVYQTYNNSGQTTSTLNGTRRLETAPDVIAPSLGSGHPCMINTSVGFSVIGGGASAGKGTVDVGCMMMRSANVTDNAAGRYYYAAKDVTACLSWKRVGAIPAAYPCTKKERVAYNTVSAPKVSTRSAPVQPRALRTGIVRCEKVDGKVYINYTFNADKAAAKAICLSSLGY